VIDTKAITQELNQLIAETPELARLFSYTTPRMRYWKASGKKFCWTTERCNDKKFYALVYRVNKDGSERLIKKCAYGRRKVAKAKALEWFRKSTEDFA